MAQKSSNKQEEAEKEVKKLKRAVKGFKQHKSSQGIKKVPFIFNKKNKLQKKLNISTSKICTNTKRQQEMN